MRDIKFRAWDVMGSKMLNWDYLVGYCDLSFLTEYTDGESSIHHTIPMQYTGLKDKNGVCIYEGDIYHQGDVNIKYKVIFKDGQFVGNQIGNRSLAGIYHWADVTEVIGNIHENPELLEVKK